MRASADCLQIAANSASPWKKLPACALESTGRVEIWTPTRYLEDTRLRLDEPIRCIQLHLKWPSPPSLPSVNPTCFIRVFPFYGEPTITNQNVWRVAAVARLTRSREETRSPWPQSSRHSPWFVSPGLFAAPVGHVAVPGVSENELSGG